jgi:hypothetical protein
MPPATAWGWNPQPLAAGSAYAQGYGGQAAAFTDCPGTEAATIGKTGLHGLQGTDTVDPLAVLRSLVVRQEARLLKTGF